MTDRPDSSRLRPAQTKAEQILSSNVPTPRTDPAAQEALLAGCIEMRQNIDSRRRQLDLSELKLSEWLAQLTPENVVQFYRTVRAFSS